MVKFFVVLLCNICIFAMRDKYGVNERLESITPQLGARTKKFN